MHNSALAGRVEEKKALLGGLGGVYCAEALEVAESLRKEPGLADEAALTVVRIADKLWVTRPGPMRALLKRLAAGPVPATVKAEARRILLELSKPINLARDAKATSPDGIEKDGAAGGENAVELGVREAPAARNQAEVPCPDRLGRLSRADHLLGRERIPRGNARLPVGALGAPAAVLAATSDADGGDAAQVDGATAEPATDTVGGEPDGPRVAPCSGQQVAGVIGADAFAGLHPLRATCVFLTRKNQVLAHFCILTFVSINI